MGGKAFSLLAAKHTGAQPIDCVRVPSAIYSTILTRFTTLLSPHFTSLTSPVPAPQKSDHGDIDILAYGPKYSSLLHKRRPTLPPPTGGRKDEEDTHDGFISSVSALLSATSVVRNSPTANFAVFVPEVKGHVQVDVHICPTRGNYEMTAFTHAYGDTWNILNTSARWCGLSVNGDGLRMIIDHDEVGERREGSRSDGRKTHLVLSTSPREVLEFWGLDPEKWYAGFETTEALFDYLSTNRFLRVSSFERSRLIKRDKKRLSKREMFIRWVDEYIPSRTDLFNKGGGMTREYIRQEALKTFGKEGEYEGIIRKIMIEKGEKKIWMRTAETLRQGGDVEEGEVGVLVRGLKKVAEEVGGEVEGSVEEVLKKKEEVIRKAVEENWREQLEEIRGMRRVHKAAAKARKKEKAARKGDGVVNEEAQVVG